MKIFGINIGRRKKKLPVASDDLKKDVAGIKDRPQNVSGIRVIKIEKMPRIHSPVLSFKLRTGVENFEEPEYDMAEIGRIEDIEGYVQRAFTQKEGLMFKEGWSLGGKNPRTIKYVKQRFEQISTVTNTPFNMTFRGLGEDLIRFSNSFIVKVRNIKASGGKPRLVPGKQAPLHPVAGYYSMPVSTVKFKRTDTGKILKYRQELPSGAYKEFAPDNVIHVSFRKKKGFLVGTPSLIPVKDDIRALRRIEENIEMLVYQCLFPLYHYTVGTENAPAREYPDGTREIDAVRAEIEVMPSEGMIVTPERHSITAVGAEGRALRAEGYLTHFKQRIFAGLGVSAVDMGEGDSSNRSTADSMSRNLVDDVKHYQRTLEAFVNEYIIKELLLESTFTDPLSEENIVLLKFNEIDIESKIKVENHASNAFNGNAITHTELRHAFGREPLMDNEWNDMFLKLIEEPRSLLSGPSPEQDRGVRAAAASTTPSNQHGKKTSPEKRKSAYSSSYLLTDMVAPDNAITNIYNDLYDDIMHSIETNTFSINWFKQLALAAGTLMSGRLTRTARVQFRNGFRSISDEIEQANLNVSLKILEARVQRIVNRLITNLIFRITDIAGEDNIAPTLSIRITSSFDSLRFRSRFIYASERIKAYNYGKLCAMKYQKILHARIEPDVNSCKDCKSKAGIRKVNELTIETIPGFHPNCKCSILIEPKNKS